MVLSIKNEGDLKNTIYNENCLTTMKKMPDKFVDLVLTDPPYGVNIQYDVYDDTEKNWYNLMESVLPEIKRVSKMAILPSSQIKRLDWIYKNFPPDCPGHPSYIGFNDWEPHLVYGKRKSQLYMHDFFQTKSSPKQGAFNHPCPKPIEWADWLITRVATNDKICVYDPFMGSGTVAVSCIKNGHDYIGSEISSKYCRNINKRVISQIEQMDKINFFMDVKDKL